MKNIKSYIFALAAASTLAMPLVGCQDDFDDAVVNAPVSTLTPNMTIAELKEMYWSDNVQGIDTIGIENGVADDKSYIIHGWVASSDEAGNVFKNLIIQDGTAAITMSINSYNLYLKYRVGQEIVMDVKGMYIGKYNGLQQLGMPKKEYGLWSATFMAPEYFYDRAELNGFPNKAKVDTLTIKLSELSTNPAEQRRLQSRLVRINNVHFTNGGVAKFSKYHSSGESQEITDETGSSLNVRTSGYCNFWNNVLPSENLDIVGILSYYNTGSTKEPWQLTLIDYDGCMNIGKPTASPGTEARPYTVTEAVALEKDNTVVSGWVKGYIVGAVAPEVAEVKSNSDINWSADDILGSTLVIGATPDTKDINDALVIALPDGSDFQKYGNLADNPGVYGKAIEVKGTLQSYMGTYGVTNNSGSKSEFKIEGVETGGGDANIPEGDGTADKPYNATQAKAKAIANGTTSTDNVYVKGYIISGSINMTYGTGTWVIADNAAGTGDTFELFGTYDTNNSKFTDANAVKTGDLVVAVGPIYNYNGKTPEMSKGHLVSINNEGGNTPNPPVVGDGNGTEEKPYTVGQIIAKNPQGNKDNPDEKGMWVTGYIVGWADMSSIYYINAETAKFTVPATANTNLLLAASPDVKSYTECIGIQLPSGDVRSSLNLVDNPGNLGKKLEIKGDICKYSGIPGMRNGSEFKLGDGGSVTPDPGPGTDPTPGPSNEYKGDFNTFNGGVPKSSPYATYTNATGWTADWSIILAGSDGTENKNPNFPFIGSAKTIAPCINGNTAKAGKLTSPKIAGGISTLTFSWGLPFKDSKISFTINILQNGTVVATDTVAPETVAQYTAYSYSHAFNVSGDCTIEIINNCPSAAEKNGDRFAIWNLTWE